MKYRGSEGKQNLLLGSGGIALTWVRVTKGKITVNVYMKEIQGKSILVRQLARGSSHRESTVFIARLQYSLLRRLNGRLLGTKPRLFKR